MSELRNEYRSTRALATFQQFAGLDDLWTRYLHAATEIPDEDVGTLGEVAAEMQGLLDNSAREAEWAGSYLSEREPLLEEGFAKALDAHPLTEEARAELRRYLDEQGGVAALVTTAAETVVKEAPDVQSELAHELKMVEAGDYEANGRKRKRFKCAILGLGVGVAVATQQYGIAVSILLHMNTIGCFGSNA